MGLFYEHRFAMLITAPFEMLLLSARNHQSNQTKTLKIQLGNVDKKLYWAQYAELTFGATSPFGELQLKIMENSCLL